MPTRAESRFNFIRTLVDEQRKLEEEGRRITTRERKKKSRSGIGSILGTIIGALLAPATGGLSVGVGAGLGSRLGSEVGERTTQGSSQIDPSQFLFSQPQIEQRNFEQGELDRGFNQGQWVDALFKGITAGSLAPEIGRFKDVGRSVLEGSKRFGGAKDAFRFIGSGELPLNLQASQEALGTSGGFGLGQKRPLGTGGVLPTGRQLGKAGSPMAAARQKFTGALDPFLLDMGSPVGQSSLAQFGFDITKWQATKDLTGQPQLIQDMLKGLSKEEIEEYLKQMSVRRSFASGRRGLDFSIPNRSPQTTPVGGSQVNPVNFTGKKLEELLNLLLRR